LSLRGLEHGLTDSSLKGPEMGTPSRIPKTYRILLRESFL
jgi:hypothetical protein